MKLLGTLSILAFIILVSGCTQQPGGAPGPTPAEYIPASIGSFTGKEIRMVSCGRDTSRTDGYTYYFEHEPSVM